MTNQTNLCSLLVIYLLATVCPAYGQTLIDKQATRETRALYDNLRAIPDRGFMFGHQDTDAYGVTWKAEASRSDVRDVTGSYPAVHGWDVGDLGITPFNLDSVSFDKMHQWIEATYKRGGINTISWHFDNPLTGESSWSKGDAARESLPGGKAHARFMEHLRSLADFLDQCQSGSVKIPVIFRPYHEHNGDWFWWGKGVAREEDYIKLWKFTVDYLRNERQLHHLIYAFSPDRSRIDMANFNRDYFYGYPGDDYVDVLGIDNYWDVGAKWNKADEETRRKDFQKSLSSLSALAAAKKKVAALTETGLESIPDPQWFTKVILDPIKADPSIRIAYVMVWRNARTNHHYAPYPGHPSVDDFLRFYQDGQTLFESDLRNMYGQNKKMPKK